MASLLKAVNLILLGIQWNNLLIGFLVLAVGQVIIKIIQVGYNYISSESRNLQRRFIVKKMLVYSLNFFFLFVFLKVIGVDLKLILGAAGVLTVAIGFAARSSISNLISGFFLIFEQPFVVGDNIRVKGIVGEVLSIDLLSMSLRTMDNLAVRIPNDLVMGNPVENLTRFPIRQIVLDLKVPYTESLDRMHEILADVAARGEHTLDEPDAEFEVEHFHETHIEVKFAVWTSSKNFDHYKAEFCKKAMRALKKAGYEQPHSLVYRYEPPGADKSNE